jgi:integrase
VARAEIITDKFARSTPAPAKDYLLIRDAGKAAVRGLALRITCPTRSEPEGARAWVFCYRTTLGRERRMTIGRINDWPIAAAREEAKRLRRVTDTGGDPLGERQDERAAETINDLADRFIAEHLPRLRPASRETYDGLLRNWIRPRLGTLKVKEVAYTDVDRLHRAMTAAGKPSTANRAVAVLSKMMSLAIRWKLRADNPVRGVERNLEQPRQRFLTGEELGRLMAALAKHSGKSSADAVRLLLLTGARSDEVLSATWEQFELGAGVWTKPSAHTKQKKEHRIPLSAPARQVLGEMLARARAQEEPSTHLFPGRGKKGEAQRGLKSFWRTVCGEAGLAERVPQKTHDGKVIKNNKGEPKMTWRPTVRVHDLRHSYASTLAGVGLSLPIIGALLGHTQAQTTARYAHLADAALRAATERVGAEVVAAEKGGKGGAEVRDLPSRGRP